MEIIHSITECVAVPGTDRTRLTLAGANGSHTFELTQQALIALMPNVVAPQPAGGESMVATNAISPIGCVPFESLQGLCGFAFNLGDRYLHVAVPANGIESVRQALDVIELAYRNQKMPRMPG
jgi:hypothetical protein